MLALTEKVKTMSKVFFECDRRKCLNCSYPLCRYTEDIEHAEHFKNEGSGYIEKIDGEPITELVRCKDCIHQVPAYECIFCKINWTNPPLDGFCSYGERKDE